MLDLDDFKLVNDKFGHYTGDVVIRKVAQLVKANTRIYDYVCRIGGDELLIVFTNCSEEVVKSRVEKILRQIAEVIVLPDLSLSASAGMAINTDNSPIEEVIKQADAALYQSKREGKNRLTVYSKGKKLTYR